LLAEGHAYRCFCNEMTLNLIRKEAVRTRQTPRYDNRCRHLTKDDIAGRLAQGQKYAIRFKLSTGRVAFKDLVMSDIRIDLSETESDFVIMKSDGFPTYHLANVIDDRYMQITHVMRGIEWLHSTPKHLMLYAALGWNSPQFAHMPLILNQGGGKLSKRHEHVNLEALKNSGVRPEAILNYLASIGGGFDLELSRNNSEIYSMQQLIDAFDVHLIRNIPNKLDNDKLRFFNRLALQKAIDRQEPELLTELKRLIQFKLNVRPEEELIRRAMATLRDRVSTVNEMVDDYGFFWTDEIADDLTDLDGDLYARVIDNARSIVSSSCRDASISPGEFDLMKQFCAANSIKYGKYMQMLRLSLTGKKDGLPIGELYELLGKEAFVRKMENFRSKLLGQQVAVSR
jgi:glutamyl-tRNA synthetase